MVVDASLALRILVPSDETEATHALWESWHQEARLLVAPCFWAVEITSALRRLEWAGELSAGETETALARSFELGVDLLPVDLPLARAARAWAERLGQSKAYDGFYVALAELGQAELWTADRRLVTAARQLGVPWVRGLEG